MQVADPFAFLPGVSAEGQRELHGLGQSRRYERGSVVFREDDDGSQVMILLDGTAKVSVSAPSGREVILHVFDAGCLLGEFSAVDGAPRSATVTALTDLEVLVIKHDEFVGFLRRHADAATLLLQLVVAKVRAATQRQLEFGTAAALSRVCRALLDFGARYGDETPDGVRFTLPMSQQDLAAFVGLSRESIVKTLVSMRSLGWIQTSGREVVLCDVESLTSCANNS